MLTALSIFLFVDKAFQHGRRPLIKQKNMLHLTVFFKVAGKPGCTNLTVSVCL